LRSHIHVHGHGHGHEATAEEQVEIVETVVEEVVFEMDNSSCVKTVDSQFAEAEAVADTNRVITAAEASSAMFVASIVASERAAPNPNPNPDPYPNPNSNPNPNPDPNPNPKSRVRRALLQAQLQASTPQPPPLQAQLPPAPLPPPPLPPQARKAQLQAHERRKERVRGAWRASAGDVRAVREAGLQRECYVIAAGVRSNGHVIAV
jgi:hypothetical protein